MLKGDPLLKGHCVKSWFLLEKSAISFQVLPAHPAHANCTPSEQLYSLLFPPFCWWVWPTTKSQMRFSLSWHLQPEVALPPSAPPHSHLCCPQLGMSVNFPRHHSWTTLARRTSLLWSYTKRCTRWPAWARPLSPDSSFSVPYVTDVLLMHIFWLMKYYVKSPFLEEKDTLIW